MVGKECSSVGIKCSTVGNQCSAVGKRRRADWIKCSVIENERSPVGIQYSVVESRRSVTIGQCSEIGLKRMIVGLWLAQSCHSWALRQKIGLYMGSHALAGRVMLKSSVFGPFLEKSEGTKL